MKKLLIWVITITLISLVGLFIFTRNNHSSLHIDTWICEWNVQCQKNVIVTSTIKATVYNLSSRQHSNFRIMVTEYDKKKNIIKEKIVEFPSQLNAGENMTKTITLPAKAKDRDCQIIVQI